MRTLTAFAKEKSLILLFATAIFLGSCGKGSGPGGHVDPPATPKPTVSAPTPSTGWYDSSVTGTFSVSSQGEYTVSVSTDNGTPVTLSGNTYTLSGVKGPTKLTIAASNKGGQTTATVDISVYTSTRSRLCLPLGKWRKVEERWSLDSLSLDTAPPAIFSCGLPTEFRPQGLASYYGTECGSPADQHNVPYDLGPEDKTIRYLNPIHRTFVSVTDREFVVKYKNNVGLYYIKETWRR